MGSSISYVNAKTAAQIDDLRHDIVALQSRLRKLPLKNGQTLDELLKALDLAWIGATRLMAELDPSRSSGATRLGTEAD